MARDIYVALGDSITAGYDATHPAHTFVHQFYTVIRRSQLAQRTTVIAQNGWDTQTLQRAVQSAWPKLWDEASVATVLIGGNDLRKLLTRQFLSGAPVSPHLITLTLQKFARDLDILCHFLQTREIPHLILGTLYNPAPNYLPATHAIEELNAIISLVAKRYDMDVADIAAAFSGKEAHLIHGYRFGRIEDLSVPIRRPIHPNDDGHRTIARVLTERLDGSLST